MDRRHALSPRGILMWRAKPRPPDARDRLKRILGNVKRIRRSCYPADWTADPLYMVERELEDLLEELA